MAYLTHRLKSGDFWVFDKLTKRSSRYTEDGQLIHGSVVPMGVFNKKLPAVRHSLLFRVIGHCGFPPDISISILQNDIDYAVVMVRILGTNKSIKLNFWRDVLGVMIYQDTGESRFSLSLYNVNAIAVPNPIL